MMIGKERRTVHFEDVTPGAVISEGIRGNSDHPENLYIKLMPEDEEHRWSFNAVNLVTGTRREFKASAEVKIHPDARCIFD